MRNVLVVAILSFSVWESRRCPHLQRVFQNIAPSIERYDNDYICGFFNIGITVYGRNLKNITLVEYKGKVSGSYTNFTHNETSLRIYNPLSEVIIGNYGYLTVTTINGVSNPLYMSIPSPYQVCW